MDKLKIKELQQLRQEKQDQEFAYHHSLQNIISSSETLAITLNYCQQFLLQHSLLENLSEYSPTNISRLVFQEQLEAISIQFDKLPKKSCRIEHFLAIMLKIMKFAFQKCPFYMVGLKDMFYEIAEDGKSTITYPIFFKYILGEVVTIKEEDQNTQFQVQFQERKKQDYLLHDNGIEKIYLSKDLKLFLSLDERSSLIKIYDEDMKNISKFSPKKEKHNNRFPMIVGFDYSELTMRLGLILSDCTISSIHLPNYLSKSPAEFESSTLNELVFPMPEKMRKVYFMQMMNKWLTISEEDNKCYLFDMEKVRMQPEKVLTKVQIDTNDLNISNVMEIVALSAVAIVAGNQITFYNETITDLKFAKFSHCEVIENLKYCEEKNSFYLSGKEKIITIFSINRNNTSFKISNFQINKIITDFEVFPFLQTIAITDQNHDLRLYHEPSKICYQQHSYAHIVKAKDKKLKLNKISKNEFMIYQTYMLILLQDKIAIEKDIEYSFLPYTYFDQKKEELYISVNHQILSFSLLHGEIRKNYSFESSNIQKHEAFVINKSTPLFILDSDKNVYEVYQKDQNVEGENRSYRKKIAIGEVIKSFYDCQLKHLIVVGQDCYYQIRNDCNNNFNLINSVHLESFNKIIQAAFCDKSKYISLMTSDQYIYQIKNFEMQFSHCFKCVFPKDSKDYEERVILQFEYDAVFEIFILLTNKNEIYFFSRLATAQQIYVNIEELMPHKLKTLKFLTFKYELIGEGKRFEPYVMVLDETGFFVELKLTQIFQERFSSNPKEQTYVKGMFKDSHNILNNNIAVTTVELNQLFRYKSNQSNFSFIKAHQKAIAILLKVKLEFICTLSIGIDGYVRLWNEKKSCLFSLKIPSLLKIVWKMSEVQDIKNEKSIHELLIIFQKHFGLLKDKKSPMQMIHKSKKAKKETEPKKVKDMISIQFENKDLEDLVMRKEDYHSYYSSSKEKKKNLNTTAQATYPHPWRIKKQFIKMYEKASPTNKYKVKIPYDLINLRSSLDMTERIAKRQGNTEKLVILPQLSAYEPEKAQSLQKKKREETENEEVENFESCLYIKSERRRKQINAFDEIDKEFKKKEMAMTGKRWIPKRRIEKDNTIEVKSEVVYAPHEGKYDPIQAVLQIFEDHNKETHDTKKGRAIRIPKINYCREDVMFS